MKIDIKQFTYMARNSRKQRTSGFTLIELLVVITIIGILATLAPAAIGSVLSSANRARALNNARNIGLALKSYANEHNGVFPGGEKAADAFSKLLPQESGSAGYISDLRQFSVKGSRFTPQVEEAPGKDQKKLADGDNHWAYMAGLDDSGNGRWPLVFDGPASAEGKYSAKKTEKGGVWEGKVAIVVRLDGSATAETLTDLTVKTDGQDNTLKSSENWAPTGKLVMP